MLSERLSAYLVVWRAVTKPSDTLYRYTTGRVYGTDVCFTCA